MRSVVTGGVGKGSWGSFFGAEMHNACIKRVPVLNCNDSQIIVDKGECKNATM